MAARGRPGKSPDPVDPLPDVLPPIGLNGSHWVSGRWTNPGQLGDDDGTRVEMWDDDFAGTDHEVERLVRATFDVFLGMDSNTPKAHLPKFTDDQVFVYNTGGYDKLIWCPGQGSPYTVTIGKPTSTELHSDHDLHVMPVTLSIAGVHVLTFRFGTANINHSMSAEHKREDIAEVHELCDVVVWQEIDTDVANGLIDEEFAPAEWYHLFADYETDMSIRRSMFTLVTKAALPKGITVRYDAERISTGVKHVGPHRYDVWAIAVPIPQAS